MVYMGCWYDVCCCMRVIMYVWCVRDRVGARRCGVVFGAVVCDVVVIGGGGGGGGVLVGVDDGTGGVSVGGAGFVSVLRDTMYSTSSTVLTIVLFSGCSCVVVIRTIIMITFPHGTS